MVATGGCEGSSVGVCGSEKPLVLVERRSLFSLAVEKGLPCTNSTSTDPLWLKGEKNRGIKLLTAKEENRFFRPNFSARRSLSRS